VSADWTARDEALTVFGQKDGTLTATEGQSTGVLVWWAILTTISAVNIVLWIVVARRFARKAPSMEPAVRRARKWQLALSALFVAGCAFRSLLPRAEGQRICLYDSWISAAVISRAVATVAELSLVTQWTIFLREYARGVNARLAMALSCLFIPLIINAEVFSWYTTLTTNFIGSCVEESTWAVTALLIVISFSTLWNHYQGARRRIIGICIASLSVYFIFMCSVDVPMYRARYVADQARGKQYLSVADGWHDASNRWVLTRTWADWRDEMPWMSLYFTAGVWISLSMVRIRPFRDTQLAAERARLRGASPPMMHQSSI
jgi:hypothetical protein